MSTSDVHDRLRQAREASYVLQSLPSDRIDSFLLDLASALLAQAKMILQVNKQDLARMDASDPSYDRLQLTPERIASMAADLQVVADLPSPLGVCLEEKTLANALHLQKITVPFGVIGMIYEARPNVTIDALSLCLKAGSAVVLKGGKDAAHSNEALISIVYPLLQAHGMHPDSVVLLPSDRFSVDVLLAAHGLIDVIIPRGGKNLIDFVRQHARVPIIETGAGVVHTYVDSSANLTSAADIIVNAKTRRASVCNALDTLIIHRDLLSSLPVLLESLDKEGVEIFADDESFAALADGYTATRICRATEEHFGMEFLSLQMSIKTVGSVEEAITHIRHFGSQHSEAILTEDSHAMNLFLKSVDAAVVYANASVAFTDGAEFGFGAEIGISTQKLHARGPMGLREIVSYKWLVRGNGQTRT